MLRQPSRVAGIRVLVVDGSQVMHLGFRALLTSQSWVERCVVATEPASAVELAARFEPHVVILDPDISVEPCRSVLAAIREVAPDSRSVLLSTGSVSIAAAKACGASALLAERATLDQVTRVIRIVAAGGTVFKRADTGVGGLSPRECDVLRMLAAGGTNSEIAARLYLSRETVKKHAGAIYRKLGVRNRTEAAQRAGELGLAPSVAA